jgi:para-aminobenzoate synthetase component 1
MPTPLALPLVHRLELGRTLAPLRALARWRHPFLLHSALPDADRGGVRRARWTFFGADPFAIFRGGDHLQAIDSFRRFAATAPQPDEAVFGTHVPFWGGAVGYWSYDYGRRLERLPESAQDDTGLPDFVLALHDVVGAYDHDSREAWLFSSGMPFTGADAARRAMDRLRQFEARMAVAPLGAAALETPGVGPVATSTFTPERYRRGVEAVRGHIARGDIFQANLSQRWTVPLPEAPSRAVELYEAMVLHTPAPFAAYLHHGDHAVLSASMERFLELRGQHVETRPIKGTRPRGATLADDERLAAELLASPKDRAENVMIVDVARNDLGRVCDTGTVTATDVCTLERYPQVHHLVSTVTGRLREGLDAFDLLHAAFPGASITGAPKIRAMEILDSLEPVRRHAYCGAIGWLGWDGDADWNIAIRTATLAGDTLRFAAGGGITADSDPDAEYRETLAKAEGLRAACSSVLGEIALTPASEGAR